MPLLLERNQLREGQDVREGYRHKTGYGQRRVDECHGGKCHRNKRGWRPGNGVRAPLTVAKIRGGELGDVGPIPLNQVVGQPTNRGRHPVEHCGGDLVVRVA